MGKTHAISDGVKCGGEKMKKIGIGGTGAILKGVLRKGLTPQTRDMHMMDFAHFSLSFLWFLH